MFFNRAEILFLEHKCAFLRQINKIFFWMILLTSESAYANLCISTSEGLSPELRIFSLLVIGLSVLLLVKGKKLKEMIGRTKVALNFFRLMQALVFTAGVLVLIQNVILMEYFVINPNLHAEGSYCEKYNPGPCFSFLGDDYCLMKAPVSVSFSQE